ncbi:S28 family serine protease [Aureibacter tunicatorum]|uniref:PS-10 peptidase S37 n=1 Tax=Aureibacter tunicatorum TaxID=866807 RepID=A0AAE3XMZ0_9BACT|nr:S28 family serine protease [Aureibacter tunicatorum]MDR6240891.1 hypothetical protein [Aureibacter tunicatorum]BDD03671.1 tripeptidyl aminopeptidase [Aureibacter tunicatorum]
MKNLTKPFAMFVMLLTLFASCQQSGNKKVEASSEAKQTSKLREFLGTLENVQIEEMEISDPKDEIYSEKYKLMFTQPIDHKDLSKGVFQQKVVLSHVSAAKPIVAELQGYVMWSDKAGELSTLLESNQVVIEHRYFGESMPKDCIQWSTLNIEQAAADQHAIISKLKKFYTSKWITTGISKGGQTTIYHKYFYPEDVDVAVPYVAPIMLALEEDRIYPFLDQVGTKECRDKVYGFQRAMLERKAELLPKFKEYTEEKGYDYVFDLEGAYDYGALEFPFGFWQWGYTSCDDIVAVDADAQEFFDFMVKAVRFRDYDKATVKETESFYYQASTQLGYYGYRTDGLEDLLSVENPNNQVFAPKGIPLEYDNSDMKKVVEWLKTNDNNFLYLYGEYDTWTACAIDISDHTTNAVKMVHPKGSHGVRIKHFSEEDKNKIYDTLESWLKYKIPESGKAKTIDKKKKLQ